MGNNTWVYVLQCTHDTYGKKYFYVGVTKNLFKRFNQHRTGHGALCTQAFSYDTIAAMYKIGEAAMTDKERRQHENQITLQLMKLSDSWFYVRGGQWTTHGLQKFSDNYEEIYTTLDSQPLEAMKSVHMPVVCHCRMPAILTFDRITGDEVYVCSLKHNKWLYNEDINLPLDINDSCDFKCPRNIAVAAPPPNVCACGCFCGSYETCYACFKKTTHFENLDNMVIDTTLPWEKV